MKNLNLTKHYIIDPDNVPNTFLKLFLHFVKPIWFAYSSFIFLTLLTFIGYSVLGPLFSKSVIGKIETFTGNKSEIFAYVFPTIVFFSCFDIFLIGLNVISSFTSIKYIKPIREFIVESLTNYVHSNSLQYISDNSSGKLYQKITDVSNLFSVIDEFFWIVVSFIIMFVTNLLIITDINIKLSLVFVCWILFHIIWGLFKIRKIKLCEEIYSKSNSEIAGKIIDTFVNFLNVKIFSESNNEEREFNKYTNEKIKLKQDIIFAHRRMWIPQDLFGVMIFFLTLCLSLKLYQQEEIKLSDIAYFFTSFGMINHNLFRLTESLTSLISRIVSVNVGIKDILVPITVKDRKDAKPLNVDIGEIEFKNVYFKYKEKFVIKDFSLKIKSGEKIGVVGPSGAGKTTLVNLLLRFYDVDNGQILIDNQDINGITQSSLRKHISFVAQDISMFNRTIYDNIAYALPNAKYEDVIRCSKQAQADEFITKLPEKYDTIVGERGIKLSGGQKQRISIARSLLKNSKIVILDEATSALDSKTETFIQDKLLNLLKGKTTIVIAHRLSTLRNMDRIIVMKNGKIVEVGNHLSLLRKNGEYANLWNLQSNGFISEE